MPLDVFFDQFLKQFTDGRSFVCRCNFEFQMKVLADVGSESYITGRD
jgi:hypothetical protein